MRFAFVYISPGLVDAKIIVPQAEVPPPTVPMDYNWARELGLIRKPASFMSSICDERGQELLYAGMPITDVFQVFSRNREHCRCQSWANSMFSMLILNAFV